MVPTKADNPAWAAVIEVETGVRYRSKYALAQDTGASVRKIEAMVGRCRAMRCAGIKPTGDWWHDRVTVRLPNDV